MSTKPPTPAAAAGSKKSDPSGSAKELSPRQRRFVDEYLVDLNGTQAAIRAGYSPRTAGKQAFDLLKKREIAAAVAAKQAERSERTGIDADWVLRRLAEESDADLADLYDEVGNLRHPKDWPLVWRKGLVAGVETFMVPNGEKADDGKVIYAEVRKVKLADRTRLIELIGKHVQVSAFREQVGLSDPLGGPVQMAVAVELPALKKALERVRGGS